MGLGSDLTPLYFWTFILADCIAQFCQLLIAFAQQKMLHKEANVLL